MGTIGPQTGERGPGLGADLLQRAAEAIVKGGLEALIASGVLAAVFLGGLAYVMRDLPMVLGIASGVLLLLLMGTAVYVAVLRHRHHGLVAERAPTAAAMRTRLDGLETLLQQLRAVDLEMTALRCHGRTDPETNSDEARRDCARVVLRPAWGQLENAKAGHVRVAWHVWDESRQRFRHVVATPEFRPAERDAVAQLGRDSAAGRALNDGAPNIIPDVSAPEALQLGWMSIPHHHAVGSSIQAPVYRIGGRVPNEWLGIISVDCDAVHAFDHADGDLLMEFAVKLNVIYEGMFDPDEPMDATTGRT